MDREGFRNRLKQYKKAREENPGLKYWEWKYIPKYDEDINGVTLKEKEDAFWRGDTQKMAELVEREGKQLTYVTPQSNMDEVVITANKPKQNQYSELDFAKDVAGFVPILGEAVDIYDAGKSLYNGNYSQAALLGAGLLLPNWLEKSGKLLKHIWKGNGKGLINYSSSSLQPRSKKDINKDLFYSQKDLQDYLNADQVQKRMDRADRKYNTQYKKYSDFIINKINGSQPNNNYHDPLFIPSVIKENGGFGGGYDPMTKSFYFSPLLQNKKNASHTLHHETQHFLDDVASNANGLDKNSFLNIDYFSLNRKSLPQLFFDYGLKNIITSPINTAKNALSDAYYFSRPTEIRAYFSDKIFKPRYENNIQFDTPFTQDELSNNIIKHIVLSQKANTRKQFLQDINEYGFAEGGQVEPDPLEVLERSRPKVAGIPINDSPIESVFSPWDIVLGTSYRLMPFVNKVLPNYGPALGTLILGDAATSNKQQPLITKKLDPDVSEFYKDIVIPMNPNDEVYKQYFMKQFGNPDIEVHPASNLPDNFAADYNPNTNKIRIREDYAMSPNYQQIEAHEYGHLLDKYLPYDETAQQQLNNSLKVSKTPISKDSDTYRERQSSKREGELKAFLNLKKAGKMKVKTSRAKTKRYQEYLANASDEEILELLGADTAYKQDYLAGNIDIDTLRQQMIYAPTITAGLVVPEYLLIDDEEEKQWT